MPTDDLLSLATGVSQRASEKEDVEAFAVHQREFSAKAYEGAIESISAAEPRGLGVRVVTEGRVGFSYTTDLSESGLEAVLDSARDNARHATPDEAVGLGEGWADRPADPPGLIDPEQSRVAPEAKALFVVELEKAARALDPRVRTIEEAVYADSDSEVAIATSTGIAGAFRRTDAWCYVVAIASEGDDTQVAFDFDLARGISGLDHEAIARRAAEKAVEVLGAEKIPSAKMPVIFDPYTAGQFLGVLARALTGEAVQKGRSLFAGKLDTEVASQRLTLVDDGRAEGSPGAAPWDAEGVPTQRTEVIKDGRLTSLLYDVTSARREGRASTGNASRAGFKSIPHPSPTNLAFESTGETRDELTARAGRALLVRDFHGVHSGANPISGDFSVGVTGHLLDNGSKARPVKEVTIAAPMLDILSGIEAVATDRRWLPFEGSFGGATTLVAEMTVAGS